MLMLDLAPPRLEAFARFAAPNALSHGVSEPLEKRLCAGSIPIVLASIADQYAAKFMNRLD
jgi:hypothetical protein